MYLSNDVLTRFLQIPDVLHVSPDVFQIMSSVAAFPFQRDAPVILEFPEVVIAVTLLTSRWERVLSRGVADRKKVLFKSLAVYDRAKEVQEKGRDDRPHREDSDGQRNKHDVMVPTPHAAGFQVDEAGDDEPEDAPEADDDDDLVLSALDALHVDDTFKVGNSETIHGAMIPADNFRRLITLLLLMAPMEAQERLSQYPVDQEIGSLRSAADSILAAFLNVEKSPGVKFKAFSRVMDLLPHMLDPLNALFEHFLFSRNLDFTKHRSQESKLEGPPATRPAPPVLPQTASILNHALLSQLSFFLKGSTLFRRLMLLYSGDRDGFSLVSPPLFSHGSRFTEKILRAHLRRASSTGGPRASSS